MSQTFKSTKLVSSLSILVLIVSNCFVTVVYAGLGDCVIEPSLAVLVIRSLSVDN
jgi:hypothetical protein